MRRLWERPLDIRDEAYDIDRIAALRRGFDESAGVAATIEALIDGRWVTIYLTHGADRDSVYDALLWEWAGDQQ